MPKINNDLQLQPDFTPLIQRLQQSWRDMVNQLNNLSAGVVSASLNTVTNTAPTSGTNNQGDFARNSTPSGTNPILGWLCITAGSPGTWVPIYAGTAHGALLNIRVFNTAGSSTYTPTTGTNAVLVEVIGGGGGGGGGAATSSSQNSFGIGGGAGGYSRTYLTSGFSGVTVTVGAGGTAGAIGGAGGAGGSSSFGSFATAAGGGAGGSATVSGASGSVGAGGGAASGGNLINGAGAPSSSVSLSALGAGSGSVGGTSVYARGGTSGNFSGAAAGGTGFAPGGGGGGAVVSVSQATGQLGGAGAVGMVLISEFN